MPQILRAGELKLLQSTSSARVFLASLTILIQPSVCSIWAMQILWKLECSLMTFRSLDMRQNDFHGNNGSRFGLRNEVQPKAVIKRSPLIFFAVVCQPLTS